MKEKTCTAGATFQMTFEPKYAAYHVSSFDENWKKI